MTLLCCYHFINIKQIIFFYLYVESFLPARITSRRIGDSLGNNQSLCAIEKSIDFDICCFVFVVNQNLLITCKQVSEMVQTLRDMTSKKNHESSVVPQYFSKPLTKIVIGLARIPLVNSYARIPPIVWKFGWDPVPEGPHQTELPPLPVEFLKEKDVLTEFVFRVNFLGD